MNLEELIKSYLWVLKVEKRIAVNSYKSYQYDFKVFENWLQNTGISVSKQDLITEYYQYLKEEKGNLKSSITRKINLIIAFFKYCNEEKGTEFFVPERQNKKLPKTYRTFLENEDLTQIREYLQKNKNKNNQRLIAIIETLYSTGLRVSELIKLKKIDFHEIKKNHSLQIIGKGTVKRVVFFNDLAIQAIDIYLIEGDKKSEWLFPITRQRIFQLLKNLGNEVGIDLDKIFPHSFRHRLLTDLVQKGMNLVNVQKIAGHKQISTTEKYTHVEDYLYEEIYKYHPLVKYMKKDT